MSLSDVTPDDLALVERVLPWNNSLTHFTDFRCGRDDLANLLDAARAEGVAALQQAGEPVAWAMLQRDGSVLRVQAEPFHEGFAQMMETDCGCTVQALGQLYPLPQQTALVEEGVEKIIGPHEPAACGASAPSETPRSDGVKP